MLDNKAALGLLQRFVHDGTESDGCVTLSIASAPNHSNFPKPLHARVLNVEQPSLQTMHLTRIVNKTPVWTAAPHAHSSVVLVGPANVCLV